MSLAEEYNEILGNRIYMPHRMQYSLLEFANKIVNRISQEYRMLYPDESLISLLRNAAWLGCEYIKLLDSTKTSEAVINPEVITAIKEHINLVTSKEKIGMYKNKEESIKYLVGDTSYYIKDHNFRKLCSIPAAVAVQWAKTNCPNINVGGCLASELTLDGAAETDIRENGWSNKLFLIVSYAYSHSIENYKCMAIYKHDANFGIYIEN